MRHSRQPKKLNSPLRADIFALTVAGDSPSASSWFFHWDTSSLVTIRSASHPAKAVISRLYFSTVAAARSSARRFLA